MWYQYLKIVIVSVFPGTVTFMYNYYYMYVGSRMMVTQKLCLAYCIIICQVQHDMPMCRWPQTWTTYVHRSEYIIICILTALQVHVLEPANTVFEVRVVLVFPQGKWCMHVLHNLSICAILKLHHTNYQTMQLYTLHKASRNL